MVYFSKEISRNSLLENLFLFYPTDDPKYAMLGYAGMQRYSGYGAALEDFAAERLSNSSEVRFLLQEPTYRNDNAYDSERPAWLTRAATRP
jgi:hypothetical protein